MCEAKEGDKAAFPTKGNETNKTACERASGRRASVDCAL